MLFSKTQQLISSDSHTLCEFNRAINTTFQALSEPLHTQLGFKYLGYKKTFLQGEHKDGQIIFETNQHWMDVYAKANFFDENDFYKADPNSNLTHGFSGIYITSDPLTHLSPKLLALKKANIWNGISLFLSHDTHQEAFHFGNTQEDALPLQYIVNHLEKTHDFILSFKDKLDKELKNFQNLPYIKFSSPKIPLRDEKLQHFFSQTSLEKIYIREFNTYFTTRELECLYLACLGQTFKQIGKYLRISPRTVEYVFNNLKIKTNVPHKQQIVRVFENSINHYCAHLKQKLLH